MEYKFNDGGRKDAGFKGRAGDCVTRAIAIASGLPYKKVYNDLTDLAKHHKVNKNDFVAKRMRKAKERKSERRRKNAEIKKWKRARKIEKKKKLGTK